VNTLLWQLRQWGRRLGAAGLAGTAMLIAALLLQGVAVSAAQKSVTQQRARLAELRLAAAARAAEPASQPLNPLAMLPPTGTASQQIGELERLARAHGLDLPRGQYSVTPLPGTSLARWQLVLPVDTPYPALHAFLAAALERQPNLALDALKLKRERIESAELEAELRMSLFVEATP
jgi:hypothetical protein